MICIVKADLHASLQVRHTLLTLISAGRVQHNVVNTEDFLKFNSCNVIALQTYSYYHRRGYLSRKTKIRIKEALC
jgi:hypothetical protein